MTSAAVYPADYRDRHPIVLTDAPKVLDVFVEGGGGLVSRERQDISDYLADYRSHGQGPLLAQVPAGPGTAPGTGRALERIREAVGGRLSVSQYRPTDPRLASPIRLSFKRLTAKVAGRCGLWPQDLGVADYAYQSRNEEYWNFGCAYQSNLAAQVADPVDLVRPRRDAVPDTARRMYNIGRIRQGQDPSTLYNQGTDSVRSSISQ